MLHYMKCNEAQHPRKTVYGLIWQPKKIPTDVYPIEPRSTQAKCYTGTSSELRWRPRDANKIKDHAG